jgi:hypothetical protein
MALPTMSIGQHRNFGRDHFTMSRNRPISSWRLDKPLASAANNASTTKSGILPVTGIAVLLAVLLISSPVLSQDLGCGFSIIPEAQIKPGCGCGYSLRTGEGSRTLFQAGLNSSDNPRMYFNGELVALQALQTDTRDNYFKKGDEFVENYRIDTTNIHFANTVSSACPGGSEGCEVIVFDSAMTISTGTCFVQVDNLVGDCGC